jgi:hypothetical protein
MNQTIRARQDVGLPRTEMNKISFISKTYSGLKYTGLI